MEMERRDGSMGMVVGDGKRGWGDGDGGWMYGELGSGGWGDGIGVERGDGG